MADKKYDKLDRMRVDIQKDRDKVDKLLEQIKQKEMKLKEAEANQIVADVDEMNMSPEQLGEFLELIRSGKLNELLGGQNQSPLVVANAVKNMAENVEDNKEEEKND